MIIEHNKITYNINDDWIDVNRLLLVATLKKRKQRKKILDVALKDASFIKKVASLSDDEVLKLKEFYSDNLDLKPRNNQPFNVL